MLRCAEEEKLGDRNDSSFGKLISSKEEGFDKRFKNQIKCDGERVETTKITRPTNPSSLISTYTSPLVLRRLQMCSRRIRRVGHAP